MSPSTTTRKDLAKVRSSIFLAAVVILIIVGLGVTCLVLAAKLDAKSEAEPAAPDARCPASASICTYRLPDALQAARDACYRTEAATRGIPSGRDAYVAWWNAASGDARADWNDAFTACQDRNQLPGGKWAWDQMVYVGSR